MEAENRKGVLIVGVEAAKRWRMFSTVVTDGEFLMGVDTVSEGLEILGDPGHDVGIVIARRGVKGREKIDELVERMSNGSRPLYWILNDK